MNIDLNIFDLSDIEELAKLRASDLFSTYRRAVSVSSAVTPEFRHYTRRAVLLLRKIRAKKYVDWPWGTDRSDGSLILRKFDLCESRRKRRSGIDQTISKAA
jgi:hypothetical protein